MKVSRLIFTKETKDKMNKSLNKREKGRLRSAKLKELDNDGRLAVAKNRYEVASMVGVSNKQVGYNWVSTLIKRKKITEILTGVNQYGQAEYEYHLGSGETVVDKPVVQEKTDKVKQNVNKKNVDGYQKGKLRFDKLCKLLEDDALNQPTTRKQLAKLICDKNDDVERVYLWINSLIQKGFINEEVVGYNQNKVIECKYSILRKPVYSNNRISYSAPPIVTDSNESLNIIKSDNIKIEINYKDFSIKLEVDDLNQLNLVISNVLQALINLRYN